MLKTPAEYGQERKIRWNKSVSAVGRVVYALARLWAVRLRNSCSILETGQDVRVFLLSKTSKLGLGANKFSYRMGNCRAKWVPVTTAWRVFRLRMEERPPIWRVAANIFE
jgi:hypothetical protein